MAHRRLAFLAALLVTATPAAAQRATPAIIVARAPALPAGALVAAFATRDLAKVIALHAADARVLTPNGQLVGPTAGLNRFYATFLRGGGTLTPGQVTFRAGVAVLEGHFELAGRAPGEPEARGTFVMLWTPDPSTEQWRVTNAAWTLRK